MKTDIALRDFIRAQILEYLRSHPMHVPGCHRESICRGIAADIAENVFPVEQELEA